MLQKGIGKKHMLFWSVLLICLEAVITLVASYSAIWHVHPCNLYTAFAALTYTVLK